MDLFYKMLTASSIIFALAPMSAAAETITSMYSSLQPNDCRTLEISEEEAGWYKGICEGVKGYRLILTEGDLRQDIQVITPAGKTFTLDLGRIVSPAFSSVGEVAEWRIANKRDSRPFALIIRFNAAEYPEQPEKNRSYLVVSKLTPQQVCVTDVVKPIAQANEKARQLAQQAASKTCL